MSLQIDLGYGLRRTASVVAGSSAIEPRVRFERQLTASRATFEFTLGYRECIRHGCKQQRP